MFICGFGFLLIKLFFCWLYIVTISPIVSLCYKKEKEMIFFQMNKFLQKDVIPSTAVPLTLCQTEAYADKKYN